MAERVRHRGGVSRLVKRENRVGEWVLRLEPENLQIDCYHAGQGPHVHDPDDFNRRLAVPRLDLPTAARVVVAHLRARGRIDVPLLVEELTKDGN